MKYRYTYSIAFTVESIEADPKDVLPVFLKTALEGRIKELGYPSHDNRKWREAVLLQEAVPAPRTYEYFINLDERGEFYADVRNPEGQTVYEIRGQDIFEDGFMKHSKDLDGLQAYLTDLGFLSPNDYLVHGN